ncbi:hypothetical protein [Acinetobacter sp. ANC 4640]
MMFYTFRLSDEFLGSNSLKIKAINRDFIEAWRKNGVIVFKNQNEVLEFRRKLQSKVDPRFIQLWNLGLSSNLITFNNDLEDVDFLIDDEDFNKIICKNFGCSTFYVDQDTEDLISTYADYKKYCATQLKEIISLDSYSDSIFLNRAQTFSNKQIDADEILDDIWNQRFEYFFKFNSTITVVDRYLFINELENDNKRGNSALLNLFRKLASKDIRLKKIEFVSNDFTDITSFCEFFEKYIWSSNILKSVSDEVKFVAKADSFFVGDFHDRLVRSDKHYIEIGLGFGDIFREPKMKRFTTLTMKPKKPVDYENYINQATSINRSNSQEWIKKYNKGNSL